MTLRIIVFVKAVPDEQLGQHLDEDTLRLERGASIISDLDEYALEAALRIRESETAPVTVTSVTMGPVAAASAVRKTLHLGVDSAVHIQDDMLVGSDALVTSRVLAAAAKKIMSAGKAENCLIIMGTASPDGNTGLMPAQIAARLDVPLLSHCSEMLCDGSKGAIKGVQYLQGYTRELESQLPAVASVTAQMPSPRYPSFKNILAAKSKKIAVWTTQDLGLSTRDIGPGALHTKVTHSERHRQRSSRTLINAADNGVQKTAAQAVDFLVERRILSGDQKK